MRIPSFAKNLIVNDQASTESELSFKITNDESKEIHISFETIPHFEKRPYDLNTVKCGSLVFSLPINYEKKIYEYEKEVLLYPYGCSKLKMTELPLID